MTTTRTLLACGLVAMAAGYAPGVPPARATARRLRARAPACAAEKPPDLEEVTEKYGLEAGLFSALKRSGSASDGEDGQPTAMATAGDLLKRYGGAYLLTSTSLAVVSFSLCYLAVDNGVDVASLLQRVGLEARHAAPRPQPRPALRPRRAPFFSPPRSTRLVRGAPLAASFGRGR